MAIKTLNIRDEILAIRALVLKPKTKTPDAAWAAFINYMKTTHGVSDIESPAGQVFMAQFNQSPGMKALLDYMMRKKKT